MNHTETLGYLTALRAQIAALNAAIMALTIGGASSYELDTGQTRQRVTNRDLNRMYMAQEALYNQLAVMQTRYTGEGVVHARSAR